MTPEGRERAIAVVKNERVVCVEDDQSVRLRHPYDDALDLSQRLDCLDTLEREVVGTHVQEHADIVRLIGQASQQQASSRRFEDSQLHIRIEEDSPRSARPRIVTLEHGFPINVDARR
ncbi:MAG: hypothetical protein R2849_02345 [Thermomicrobiales bacterium]